MLDASSVHLLIAEKATDTLPAMNGVLLQGWTPPWG